MKKSNIHIKKTNRLEGATTSLGEEPDTRLQWWEAQVGVRGLRQRHDVGAAIVVHGHNTLGHGDPLATPGVGVDLEYWLQLSAPPCGGAFAPPWRQLASEEETSSPTAANLPPLTGLPPLGGFPRTCLNLQP